MRRAALLAALAAATLAVPEGDRPTRAERDRDEAERAATARELPERGWSDRAASVAPSGADAGPSTRERRNVGLRERLRRLRTRDRAVPAERESPPPGSEPLDKLLP